MLIIIVNCSFWLVVIFVVVKELSRVFSVCVKNGMRKWWVFSNGKVVVKFLVVFKLVFLGGGMSIGFNIIKFILMMFFRIMLVIIVRIFFMVGFIVLLIYCCVVFFFSGK